MKRLFIITILTCSSILTLICQEHVLTSKIQDCKKQIDSEKLMKAMTYYFINNNADSSVFLKDSIVLSKNINILNPVFKFKEDSTFNFTYNTRLDTVRIMNSETGEVIESLIAVSEKIDGRWESDKPEKYIEIILENNQKLRYTIHEANNQIYFIKQ